MRRETARVVGERTLRRGTVSTPLAALANVSAIAEALDPATLIIESVTLDGDVEESAGMTLDASFLVFGETPDALEGLVAELHTLFGPATWASSAPIAAVRPDAAVTALVGEAFAAAGRHDFDPAPPALGFATDFGNVTRVVPAALVGVGRAEGWRYHTPAGAEEFAGPAGTENARAIAEVIGLSVIRLGAAYPDTPASTGTTDRTTT
jgi:metal-dependent amidase/aminoacylase/carboxypeptidase family protein